MHRSRLPLKNGVDLQLQSACNDANWPVVIRLADKRARTSRDQYYEVSETSWRIPAREPRGRAPVS